MGGNNLFGIISLLSRFGWKGLLIGVVVVGLMFGTNLCRTTGGPPRSQSVSDTTNTAEDELLHFAGFVFDDTQSMWRSAEPGYENAKIVV